MINERAAIIVMTKAPRAGAVKTRLAPLLTAEKAAALARCFACDTITSALRVNQNRSNAQTIVAYAPADGRAEIEAILKRSPAAPLMKRLKWIAQRGADLGARLANVCTDAFAGGRNPIVIIGTDSPTLPHAYLETAITRLSHNECDLALGATEDGGYYLIGLREPQPGIFQAVAWSTPRVYRQTLRQAAQLSLRICELPRWYDIDEPRDLQRLHDELNAIEFDATEFDATESAHSRAPTTYAWLQNNFRNLTS